MISDGSSKMIDSSTPPLLGSIGSRRFSRECLDFHFSEDAGMLVLSYLRFDKLDAGLCHRNRNGAVDLCDQKGTLYTTANSS